MKAIIKVIKPFITAVLCLCLALSVRVSVAAESASAEAESIISALTDGMPAKWLQSGAVDGAGTTSEWLVMSLCGYGVSGDYTAYRKALVSFIAEKSGDLPCVTRQKLALTAILAGGFDGASSVADDTIGKQGIMSYVFGLHLLNNGCTSVYTKASVIETLLGMQLECGGWGLSETPSVDVTAMTLQALAPDINGSERIGDAVNAAVTYLSLAQEADGGYTEYGTENAESAAQVITALCALGIDCRTDSRFTKNGKNAVDALAVYSLGNGEYSHVAGGAYDRMATLQALAAYVSLWRADNGLASFYTADSVPDDLLHEIVKAPGKHGTGYKTVVCICVAAAGATACALLIIFKKRRAANFLFVAAICVAAAAVVLLTDIRTPDAYYATESHVESPCGSVTVSVDCETIAGKPGVPEGGIICKTQSVDIYEGDTAYDVLVRIVKAEKLQLQVKTVPTVYVSSIAGIAELDYGDLSGWMVFVNGKSLSVSCGSYEVKDGDTVSWRYTLDLGKDIDGELG